MNDGGGGGTRDRREEGAAANLKSQGYEPSASHVRCECYFRELRGCSSSFFRALSLRWCEVLAPPPSLFIFADAQFVNFTRTAVSAVKMFQIIEVLSRCGIIM